MFISKAFADGIDKRLQEIEANLNGVNRREAMLMQQIDELKELNDHLMRELERERSAAAAYAEAHPDDPEEERKATSLRKQFEEIIGWNGQMRSVNDD